MHGAGLSGIVATALMVLRFILAFIFIRAGITKLSDLADFRTAVTNYQILPDRLTGAAALAVPAVEVGAGTLLVLGVLPGITAACLAALLVTFSVAIIINLARGRVFDCGCGGTAPRTISWRHVAVNALLAAGAVALALAPPPGPGLLAGPAGVFAVHLPHGAAVPAALTAALALVLASVVRAAAEVRRTLRS
jgi:uncharacterized membrane protein YphA (DoxX/SURF4 family)